jgi:hypothetical protein
LPEKWKHVGEKEGSEYSGEGLERGGEGRESSTVGAVQGTRYKRDSNSEMNDVI